MAEMIQRPETLVKKKLTAAMSAHADKPAILCKSEDGIHTYTYRRLRSDIEALGTALACKGISNGNILIVGKGGYAWALSMLTVLFGAGRAVPLDHTLRGDALLSLASYCEPVAALYDDTLTDEDCLPQNIKKLPFSSLPTLLMEGRELINSGKNDFYHTAIDPDAAALIAFAATAKPKGVMLSNTNLCHTLDALAQSREPSSAERYLSVLPPHHVYELVCGLLLPLTSGASVAFGGGLRTLLADMKELSPTSLVAIPAIVEALARRVRAMSDGRSESLLSLGITATDLLPTAVSQSAKKKLFSYIRDAFGGKLERVLCAGAPVDSEHLKLLTGVGLTVSEGYSIAECAGMAALNLPGATRIGTAGKKLPGTTLDIYNMQEDGRGEIRIKSRAVMLGYYKDPERSEEALRDGWLYTGDIGSLDKDGYLRIVGRKRNMMVTAGGKSIFPEELEQLLCRSRFVREAVVVGFVNREKRDYDLVAVLRPDTAAIEDAYGEDYTAADVRTEMALALETYLGELPPYKRPMMYVLRDIPFERNSARKIRRTGVADSVAAAYREKIE